MRLCKVGGRKAKAPLELNEVRQEKGSTKVHKQQKKGKCRSAVKSREVLVAAKDTESAKY